MRKPSRLMPKNPNRRISAAALLILLLLAIAALWYFHIVRPLPLFLVFGVLCLLGIAAYFSTNKLKQKFHNIAKTRPNDSICSFTKEFDCHKVDTWIIRSVYEEIQNQLETYCTNFPVRPSDRLLEDLGLDGDDLDMELAIAISKRSGRSLKNAETNPYFAKVKTVADIVYFFNYQPLNQAT